MQIQNEEIMKRLEKLAYQKSHPFCYSCYARVLGQECSRCGGDDLMRETESGVEYGTTWVSEELIRDNLTPIDANEEFEDSIRECYPETVKVLWMELDAVTVAMESDPTSWRIAQDEWLDQDLSEGLLIEVDSKYYRISEVENYLNRELDD
jgi:hypothetical protein